MATLSVSKQSKTSQVETSQLKSPSANNRLVVTFNVGSATLKIGVYRDLSSTKSLSNTSPSHIGTSNTSSSHTGSSNTNSSLTNPENALLFSVNMDLKQAKCKWQGDVPQELSNFTVTAAQDSALAFLHILASIYPNVTFVCVHRVVHGGSHFEPTLITDAVLAQLHDLAHLAPLHQPPALAIIDAINSIHTMNAEDSSHNFIQVAAFDTAFHAKRPRLWYEYAIPKTLRDEGVRSYGFHGLSYQSIMRRLQNHRPELANKRLIIAHLGSGCSITSVSGGQSVNSTLGFSGLDGVPMGTRSGQLDPGVLLYLMEKGWSHQQITQCLYKESGLLGLSGISNDVRELSDSHNAEATFALAHFSAHVAKAISGLLPSIQGVDAIVFTAGIGEHQANVRQQVIEALAFLNITLDTDTNHQVDLNTINSIHSADSAVEILVIATDEQYELFMAANGY